MTIEDFYNKTGWTRSQFSRASGVSTTTLAAMEKGESVSIASVRKVALAMTRQLGRNIKPEDVEGVTLAKR